MPNDANQRYFVPRSSMTIQDNCLFLYDDHGFQRISPIDGRLVGSLKIVQSTKSVVV